MFGDLLLFLKSTKVRQGQRERSLYQSTDDHAPVDKLCLSLCRIGLGFWRVSIDMKVRRNVLFGVGPAGPQASEQKSYEWFDDGGGVDLKLSLMAKRI